MASLSEVVQRLAELSTGELLRAAKDLGYPEPEAGRATASLAREMGAMIRAEFTAREKADLCSKSDAELQDLAIRFAKRFRRGLAGRLPS